MSKPSRISGGYTILEVIIVLTVSSTLFAAAVLSYNQQNRRTQFVDSVNDFTQSIQDVLNDVENGFYPSNNSFSCTVTGSGWPDIDLTGSAEQGTNRDCTFVGQAIQFAPSGNGGTSSDIDIYTLVGRREVSGSSEPAVSIQDSKPVILDNLSQRKQLISGLGISSAKTSDGTSLAGIAMVANSSSAGGVSTGLNNRSSLAAVQGGLNENKNLFDLRVKFFLGGVLGVNPIDQASNGINICLKDAGTGGRTAVVELASGESQIIVNTYIDRPCS